MARTHFSGPIASTAGFEGPISGAVTGNVSGNLTGNVTGNLSGSQSGGSVAATTITASTSIAVGSGGAVIKAIKSGTVSVDPGALAAGDELDISVTITGAAAGDIIQVMPPNAAAETGLAVLLVWVSAADTVKIRVSNVNAAAALVGGAQSWTYLWTDLT